jgi:hypothetical protein
MPQAKYITRFRDLVYVGNVRVSSTNYPSRVYYSDDPVAETIGWTNLLTKFISAGFDNGDEITGMAECLDKLLIFKHRSVWKYDESTLKEFSDRGCDSYRSIVKIGDVLHWFNRDGFWRWSGSTPELISERVKDFIDNIPAANLPNVVASIHNSFEYRAFLGDITVDGMVFNNTWFCWDTRREKSYIRCTNNIAKATCRFLKDGQVRQYFGDDDGYVYRFATKVDGIYSDNGTEIDSFFVTKAQDYDVPEDVKGVNNVTTFTKYAKGMKMMVETDGRGVYDESKTRMINKDIDKLQLTASGNTFKYKFAEKGIGKSWQFNGMIVDSAIQEKI